MEKDQVEEITYDVAQYIKFEMPVLNSFIMKLKEEEDREITKLTRRYSRAIIRLLCVLRTNCTDETARKQQKGATKIVAE
ncbi:hypothetical protein AB205_0136320 [Aquarana catesbeiana]|uniref:SARAH domain-containing protein n=1 Tax=Aquarana catesbeiana TaxID=8400 RepID=A0A2G9RQW6_AQUCT|nr:hypothetical protein AB205_0136320 [Aquarana catesbeiana]